MSIWPMSDLSIQGRADPIFDRYAEMDFNGAKPVSQVPVLAKLQAEHGTLNGLGDLAVVATPQARCSLAQVETLAASTRTDSPIPADSTTIPAELSALK
jgi:hypothetical protein